jgi:hypothetical protein
VKNSLFFVDVISGSSDRRKTNYGPLEWSHSTDPNGGRFALFGSMDVEIIGKMYHGAVKNYSLLVIFRIPVIVKERITACWNRPVVLI